MTKHPSVDGADNEHPESKSWRPFGLIISIKNYSNAGLIGITESLFLVDEEQNRHGEIIFTVHFDFF